MLSVRLRPGAVEDGLVWDGVEVVFVVEEQVVHVLAQAQTRPPGQLNRGGGVLLTKRRKWIRASFRSGRACR